MFPYHGASRVVVHLHRLSHVHYAQHRSMILQHYKLIGFHARSATLSRWLTVSNPLPYRRRGSNHQTRGDHRGAR
jgi:hypothetical protein